MAAKRLNWCLALQRLKLGSRRIEPCELHHFDMALRVALESAARPDTDVPAALRRLGGCPTDEGNLVLEKFAEAIFAYWLNGRAQPEAVVPGFIWNRCVRMSLTNQIPRPLLMPRYSHQYVAQLLAQHDCGALVELQGIALGWAGFEAKNPSFGWPQPIFAVLEMLTWLAQADRSGV